MYGGRLIYATVAMKTSLALPRNMLANGVPGEADWANHPPLDTNDYRNGDNTEYDQPDLWRNLFRELNDTIWWNPAGSQMSATSFDDGGYNKDWDLKRLYHVRDK